MVVSFEQYFIYLFYEFRDLVSVFLLCHLCLHVACDELCSWFLYIYMLEYASY